MKHARTASIATCVALLALIPITHATTNDDPNQNLTLFFFKSSQVDVCDYGLLGSALTFTTSSVPLFGHCFNFADIFGGNSTTGFVNQTRSTFTSTDPEPGIHWKLFNADRYDPKDNYSSVLYRQHVLNPSDEYKPGTFADRRVNVYGGVNCSDLDPSAKEGEKKPLLPWYGFSCWSEAEGSCGDTPYQIQSFYVNTGKESRDGKCWDFAYYGAAGRSRVDWKAMLGAVGGVVVAVWVGL